MLLSRNIRRLLQYRMILLKLRDLGFQTVFSYSLGKEAGVSAEQVRKDFSQFGIKGKKKGGYNINELIFTINGIFRKDKIHKVVLVGLGNIGTAIIQYRSFEKHMIRIVAAFDIDPAKYKKKYAVPVYPLEDMKDVVIDLDIKTAIIAVPDISAQDVADKLVEAGILGVLNFSPTVLKVPSHVSVNNIRIGHELESLIYQTMYKSTNP